MVYSSTILQPVRRQWNDIFKMPEESNCQPNMPLFPAKISLKSQSELLLPGLTVKSLEVITSFSCYNKKKAEHTENQ